VRKTYKELVKQWDDFAGFLTDARLVILFLFIIHLQLIHGCHRPGNGQGKIKFFIASEFSWEIEILKKCQGKLKLYLH